MIAKKWVHCGVYSVTETKVTVPCMYRSRTRTIPLCNCERVKVAFSYLKDYLLYWNHYLSSTVFAKKVQGASLSWVANFWFWLWTILWIKLFWLFYMSRIDVFFLLTCWGFYKLMCTSFQSNPNMTTKRNNNLAIWHLAQVVHSHTSVPLIFVLVAAP